MTTQFWIRQCFVCVSLLLSVALNAVAQTGSGERLPNVVFILADDLGYGDLSCYGQRRFETPNIDALASSGMKFTQHYSGSTVCAPSRCCLMTGLHTGHAVVRGNMEVKPEGQMPMPADTLTVAHLMQKAGYRTGIFGKWGLGAPDSASEPLKMGFDRFYGYNCQRIAHSYYPAFLWNNDQRELLFGNVAERRKEYAPDLIQRQAIEFMRENRDQPFFCFYAATIPHADLVAPEKYMKLHRGKYETEKPYPAQYYRAQAQPRAAFAAMVNVLDDYVGELVDELESLGIAEDTIVIFTSDNGPHVEGGHDPDYFNSNGGLKGHKRDLYEGGIRVPMIVSWKGQIKAGSQSQHVSAFWDFLPTMAELTGQDMPAETDGISFLPTLVGKYAQEKHQYLYWEFPALHGRVAVRKGNWKAVRYNASTKPDAAMELFDLSTDPGETNNVASENPDVLASIKDILTNVRTVPKTPQFDYLRKTPAAK